MTNCEFDILKHLKSKISKKSDLIKELDQISEKIATELQEDKLTIKQQLLELLQNESEINDSPSISLTEFFKIEDDNDPNKTYYDPKTYNNVKHIIRQNIINELYNGSFILATNDENTNQILKSLMSRYSDNLLFKISFLY